MEKRPTKDQANANTKVVSDKKDIAQLKQVYRVINDAISHGFLFCIFYEPMSTYVRTELQAAGYTLSIAAGRDNEQFDLITWK